MMTTLLHILCYTPYEVRTEYGRTVSTDRTENSLVRHQVKWTVPTVRSVLYVPITTNVRSAYVRRVMGRFTSTYPPPDQTRRCWSSLIAFAYTGGTNHTKTPLFFLSFSFPGPRLPSLTITFFISLSGNRKVRLNRSALERKRERERERTRKRTRERERE